MKIFIRLVDFYIESSIHVALSCFALVQITFFMFQIQGNESVSCFAFFGTIVGYNFVKYETLVRTKKNRMQSKYKVITVLTLLSFLAVGYSFFQLQKTTQMISVGVFILTLLYTLPFFPNRKNARNWAGVKIYIVSLCWVGVTVALPILNAEIFITADFFLKCVQRFILIFVLILIFEIIDLKNDDPYLQTVPQQIGVRRTKKLGFFLLILFIAIEMLNSHINFSNNLQSSFLELVLIFAVAILTALFLFFVNEKQSKYYTSFWAESVPILWWILLVFIQ